MAYRVPYKGKRKAQVIEEDKKQVIPLYRRQPQYRLIPVRKPPLQVFKKQWIMPDKSAYIINSTAAVNMVNTYRAGSGDDCRKRNKTITYKFMFNGTLWVQDSSSIFIARVIVYFWLVYDSDPQGQLPQAGEIFSMPWATIPSTWSINRTNSDRFLVKRKWTVSLQSDGMKVGSKTKQGNYPNTSNNTVTDMKKFFPKLKTTTEWLNTGDGTVGDCKKGALYVVCVTRAGLAGEALPSSTSVVFCAEHTCYFKSIGLQ